ncbi:MAG: DUF3857 domain-containing protein [Candidatus Glassbacteria bacterium]|nr:DUF3857 domain-containing protein [Candidatus Glassbacteria bacterium]
MRKSGPAALLFFAAVFAAANVFALSNSLEELLRDEEIIMPDNLEERYAGSAAVIVLDRKEINQSRSIDPVYIRRHVAVKVLNEDGVREFSTVKVPYYEQVKVNDFKAQIIRGGQTIEVKGIINRDVDLANADKDFIYPVAMGSNVFVLRQIEVARTPTSTDLLKLTSTDGFHKQKDRAWKIRQIDFPGLQPGDIIEYEYQFEDKRAQLYGYFYFERKHPALKLQHITQNTRMLKFNYESTNFTRRPKTVFEPRFTNQEEYDNMRIRDALRTVDINNPDSWQFYGHQYFEVTLDTVPAFPADLPLAPTFAEAASRIDFLLAEIYNVWFATDSDARVRREYFSPNWNFVFKRLTERNFPNESRSKRAISEISNVIASANSPREKVNAAVAWARENLVCTNELDRWDGYYWSSKAEHPDNVLRSKEGNSDDIAHFLISALWYNNLPVFPFYTKRRSSGMLLKNVPIETQFDCTLLALEVSRRRFEFWQPILDVPMPPDYIDPQYEGQLGFVNQSDDEDVIVENAKIPVSEATKHVCKLDGSFELAADGTLSGSVNQTLNGHFATAIKRQLLVRQAGPADALAAMLYTRWGEVTVEGEPQISDPKALSGQMTVSAKLSILGAATAGADGLVLKSSLLTDPVSIQLDGSERKLAVVYPHTGDYQSSFEITIPAGYALPDSLPEPVELKTRGFYFTRVVARQSDNTLLIKRDFAIDGGLSVAGRLYNRRYAALYKQIQEADAVELTLKKL